MAFAVMGDEANQFVPPLLAFGKALPEQVFIVYQPVFEALTR